MIVMACPPFAWIIDSVVASVFVLWMAASRRPAQSQTMSRLETSAMSALFVLLLTLVAVESFHREIPVLRGQSADRLVVIGDSISAGLGARTQPWPALVGQMSGAEVLNLSRPGATMADGLSIAERVSPQDHLVLIELGGNDLIAGEPSETFAQALDGLLTKLAEGGRTIVMFELPLLPDRIAYGQIQRRLAMKYGVWLIPKRCFAAVLAGREATSDGLHLTDEGSRRMASLVTQVLSPVLKMRSSAPTTRATHP